MTTSELLKSESVEEQPSEVSSLLLPLLIVAFTAVWMDELRTIVQLFLPKATWPIAWIWVLVPFGILGYGLQGTGRRIRQMGTPLFFDTILVLIVIKVTLLLIDHGSFLDRLQQEFGGFPELVNRNVLWGVLFFGGGVLFQRGMVYGLAQISDLEAAVLFGAKDQKSRYIERVSEDDTPVLHGFWRKITFSFVVAVIGLLGVWWFPHLKDHDIWTGILFTHVLWLFLIGALLSSLVLLLYLRRQWTRDGRKIEAAIVWRWVVSATLIVLIAGLLASQLPRGYARLPTERIQLPNIGFSFQPPKPTSQPKQTAQAGKSLKDILNHQKRSENVLVNIMFMLLIGIVAAMVAVVLSWLIIWFVGYIREERRKMGLWKAFLVAGWRTFCRLGSELVRLLRRLDAGLAKINRILRRNSDSMKSGSPIAGVRNRLSRRMSPREMVIHLYLSLIRQSARKGMIRKPSETASEFSAKISANLPEEEQGKLSELTTWYEDVRYGSWDPLSESVKRIRETWQRVVHALRNSTKHS